MLLNFDKEKRKYRSISLSRDLSMLKCYSGTYSGSFETWFIQGYDGRRLTLRDGNGRGGDGFHYFISIFV